MKKIVIPGRSGDLLQDEHSFENTPQRYRMSIVQNFDENFSAFKNDLLAVIGYGRLEDSIHPEEYRMAVLMGAIEPAVTPYNRTGDFWLTFDCQPQRWLKSGEWPVLLRSGQALYNPWQPAKPEIILKGTGAADISVGSSHIHIREIGGRITLDCDRLNAYDGYTNKNGVVTVTGGWPVLKHGETPITWSGGVQTVELIPHWWTS